MVVSQVEILSLYPSATVLTIFMEKNVLKLVSLETP